MQAELQNLQQNSEVGIIQKKGIQEAQDRRSEREKEKECVCVCERERERDRERERERERERDSERDSERESKESSHCRIAEMHSHNQRAAGADVRRIARRDCTADGIH